VCNMFDHGRISTKGLDVPVKYILMCHCFDKWSSHEVKFFHYAQTFANLHDCFVIRREQKVKLN
jgi:hypothetical protein